MGFPLLLPPTEDDAVAPLVATDELLSRLEDAPLPDEPPPLDAVKDDDPPPEDAAALEEPGPEDELATRLELPGRELLLPALLLPPEELPLDDDEEDVLVESSPVVWVHARLAVTSAAVRTRMLWDMDSSRAQRSALGSVCPARGKRRGFSSLGLSRTSSSSFWSWRFAGVE